MKKPYLFLLLIMIITFSCFQYYIPNIDSNFTKVLMRFKWVPEGYLLCIEDDFRPGINTYAAWFFPENSNPIKLGEFTEGNCPENENKIKPRKCPEELLRYYGKMPPIIFKKIRNPEDYLPKFEKEKQPIT